MKPLVSATTQFNRKVRRRLMAFSRNRGGMAAVEFALVVPLMVTMYLGLIELTQALGHNRKAVLLARTLSDVVTQSMGITNNDMNTIFNAAASTMAPYAATNIAMRVTSLAIDGAGTAYVDWSSVKNIAATNPYDEFLRCRVSNDLIPAAIRSPRSWIVFAEVKIRHVPLFGTFVAPTGVEMIETIPMRPRVTTSIVREGVPTTPPCPGVTP